MLIKREPEVLGTSTSWPSWSLEALVPVPIVVTNFLVFVHGLRCPRVETRNLKIQDGEDVENVDVLWWPGANHELSGSSFRSDKQGSSKRFDSTRLDSGCKKSGMRTIQLNEYCQLVPSLPIEWKPFSVRIICFDDQIIDISMVASYILTYLSIFCSILKCLTIRYI